MSEEIEIEFKNLLTNDEFTVLKRTFQIENKDFFTQKNHYFDTRNFSLKEKQAALRIRELNGYYELTLKKKAQTEAIETNQKITPKQAELFINAGNLPGGEVKDALTKLDIFIEELTYFGTLTTHRAEIHYQDGLLVLDHSCYLGQEDFELEYEVDHYQAGEKIFKDLLNQLNIPMKPSDTKIGRFYKAKYLEMKHPNEE